MPVTVLQSFHVRRSGRHSQGVVLNSKPQVLRVQELCLVLQDWRSLLATHHGETGRHVEVNVVHGPLSGQATVALCSDGGASGPGVGAGAGAGRSAGLPRGRPPGVARAGDHGDGLHQPARCWRSVLLLLLFGFEALAAAGCHKRAYDDKGHEDGAHDKERHIDRHWGESRRHV